MKSLLTLTWHCCPQLYRTLLVVYLPGKKLKQLITMTDFNYQKPFPILKDETSYRLITTDYVSTVDQDGRKILKVAPEGLELLAREAFTDVSFYLRAAHLEKLVRILEDPEATDNDRFVAYTMLLNQVVSAEGELPTCQDTGTALVIGKKGENVFTGVNDARYLSKGIFDTYKEKNLRYSQVVPLSMFEEKNTGTNLPAQIDIYAEEGSSYEFLFITKGGGSANKSYLYQQTKSLLTEDNLTKFVKEKIYDLGTSACPPYHLALVIGGTSAEATLSAVKKHRPVITIICLPKATKAARHSAIWSGRGKWSKFAVKAVSAPSLEGSISCTMFVLSGYRGMLLPARLDWV
jgi:fumarate hydratase, class I